MGGGWEETETGKNHKERNHAYYGLVGSLIASEGSMTLCCVGRLNSAYRIDPGLSQDRRFRCIHKVRSTVCVCPTNNENNTELIIFS